MPYLIRHKPALADLPIVVRADSLEEGKQILFEKYLIYTEINDWIYIPTHEELWPWIVAVSQHYPLERVARGHYPDRVDVHRVGADVSIAAVWYGGPTIVINVDHVVVSDNLGTVEVREHTNALCGRGKPWI